MRTSAVTSVWYVSTDFQTWHRKELLVWTNYWSLQFSFNSRSIFLFQSPLIVWWSSPMIQNKCCISIQIRVFFICILKQLNWQRTNHNQSLYSLSKLQSAGQYAGCAAFIKRSHTSWKIRSPFRPHWCANEPQHKIKFGGEWNVKQKMTSSVKLQHEPSEKTLRVPRKWGEKESGKR